MIFHKPEYPSEGDVQAEFYRRCKNAGIEIHLEYKGDERCRFDAVIVRGKTIVCIVECKKHTAVSHIPQNRRQEESQMRRYGAFGVPLVWVRGMAGIEAAFAEVRRIIAARSGGGWQQNRRSGGDGSRTV